MVSMLAWDPQTGWPFFNTDVFNASSGSVNVEDNFSETKPGISWQWDWRHSSPRISQSSGMLSLTGNVTTNNPTGLAITVRPSQPSFSVSTEVSPTVDALCGITYYGDAHAAIGVGVKGDKVLCWMTKENDFTILQEIMYAGKSSVELMMTISRNHQAQFKYKAGREGWKVVNSEPIPIDFLPQWDRSPRPGLHVKGNGAAGSFSYFKLQYQ